MKFMSKGRNRIKISKSLMRLQIAFWTVCAISMSIEATAQVGGGIGGIMYQEAQGAWQLNVFQQESEFLNQQLYNGSFSLQDTEVVVLEDGNFQDFAELVFSAGPDNTLSGTAELLVTRQVSRSGAVLHGAAQVTAYPEVLELDGISISLMVMPGQQVIISQSDWQFLASHPASDVRKILDPLME